MGLWHPPGRPASAGSALLAPKHASMAAIAGPTAGGFEGAEMTTAAGLDMIVHEDEPMWEGGWKNVYISDTERMIQEANRCCRLLSIPRRYRLQPAQEHFIIVHVEVFSRTVRRDGSIAVRPLKVINFGSFLLAYRNIRNRAAAGAGHIAGARNKNEYAAGFIMGQASFAGGPGAAPPSPRSSRPGTADSRGQVADFYLRASADGLASAGPSVADSAEAATTAADVARAVQELEAAAAGLAIADE
jgi:hypothetical protein